MQSIKSGKSLRELIELVIHYSNNWAGLLAVFASIAPVIIVFLLAVVKMLFKKLYNVISLERMSCIHYICANFSVECRKELCRYNIPTHAQDIDPRNQEEIRDNNGKFCLYRYAISSLKKHLKLATEENIISYWLIRAWEKQSSSNIIKRSVKI